MRSRFALAALAIAAVYAPARAIDKAAPAAPRDAIVDTFHGETVADPYRWLENGDDPRTVAWSEAENARARAALDLPIRTVIASRLRRLYAGASPSWTRVIAAGGHIFALASVPPRQQPMVAVMGPDLNPRTQRFVIDPNTIDPSGQTAIDWFVPSPDGLLVAASLSRNGSEDGSVHVFRTADGTELGDVIPRAQFPTAGGSLAWAPNSKGFWVTRYPGDERPPADRHFFQQVYFHKLGTDPASDTYVAGKDFPRIAEIVLDNRFNPNVLMMSVADGDGGTFEHIVVGADGVPHQIDGFADGVVAATTGADGTLYMVSRAGAPRGKLLALAPGHTSLADARVLVPEGSVAIQGGGEFGGEPVVVTPDALYVRELDGGPSRVAIYRHDGTPDGLLPLPDPAAVPEVDPVGPHRVVFAVETYVRPPMFLSWDESAHRSGTTALVQTSSVSFSDATVTRVLATSRDGTKVPVTIVARRGVKLDGRNPALLYGYGGYGVSLTPEFLGPEERLWLDAGGVYAVANLRGGGEYGEQWHLDGALTKKQNVFDDFYAATRLLIDRHYTSPAHLAILGGSNGGLLMGAALTQHPSCYRAVVSLVGIYDMMRVELDPNGTFNVTEFGTVKDPAEFKAMIAYSPYHNVRNGVAYPAVFMATGTHDGRVNPMHSRKMIAALQSATSSGHPIYLAISDKSGHGIGSSLDVKVSQRADDLTFLFTQLAMHLGTSH